MTDTFAPSARPQYAAIAWATKDEIFVEKSDPMDTAGDCVCIDEEGVWWQSFAEYGTGDLRTELVPWDKLFEGRL